MPGYYSYSNFTVGQEPQQPTAYVIIENIKRTEEDNADIISRFEREYHELALKFPELMGMLNDVRVQLQSAQSAYVPPPEPEESSNEPAELQDSVKVRAVMSECKDLVPAGCVVDLTEEAYGPTKPSQEEEYFNLLKRCLQLIHPDKLHKQNLTPEVKKKLLVHYHTLMQLRRNPNGVDLLFTYFDVCKLLGIAIDERAQSYIQVLNLKLEDLTHMNLMLRNAPMYSIITTPDRFAKLFKFESMIRSDIESMLAQLEELQGAAF